MRRIFLWAAAVSGAAGCFAAGAPQIGNVRWEQKSTTHEVVITYTLSGGPAVVTMAVQTNAADGAWVAVDPQNFTNATGDVFQLVDAASGTIKWKPFEAPWVGTVVKDKGARAVLTAWPVDAPPDYFVLDLAADSAARFRYYPSADYLPGGLLGDDAYRTTKLVMRRVRAAGVPWTMGNSTRSVPPHPAVLDADYYFGVFEFTQGQHKMLYGAYPYNCYYTAADRDLHPCDMESFFRARECNFNANAGNAAARWPNAPYGWSLLGRLRARTEDKVAFDLPTEAQWEFACQAGMDGNETWNDGTYHTADNMPGQSKERAADVTAAVGSFAPNALGLYDLHGNVWEWCLDWYAVNDDAAFLALNGAVNVCTDPSVATAEGAVYGDYLADGVTQGTERVRRGSSCHSEANTCRTEFRTKSPPNSLYNDRLGLRVACPAKAVK